MSDRPLTHYAWLSIAAALATMALKLAAWRLTGSVGLLSDALESLVNLGGAAMALWMLHVAAAPPDQDHAYGHAKAEYFSSGFEGTLIFVAGALICWTAVPRLLAPRPIEQATLGLGVSAVASVINFVVARVLLRAGTRHGSVALQADGHHLITDVWTSVGVIAGVALVAITGWAILDPLIAIAVALNILWTGARLLREAAAGLMDSSWPELEQKTLAGILAEFRADNIEIHAVRTRRAAAQHFVSFHVLVPGAWSVQQGHDLLERIESRIAERIPHVVVMTHLEPIEDPAAHDDLELERRR